MRLLQRLPDGKIIRTKDYIHDIPDYAVLSHTWGADSDEVSFDDFTVAQDGEKAGYGKIQFCGRQADSDGIQHFWIDTCCINKASHSELSEAIASMYRCDEAQIAWETSFCQSRWFTRGWTLQELLAPRNVEFFSKEGAFLGDKTMLEHLIHKTTRIPVQALRGTSLAIFSVEERMLWASERRTTREEDKAYCLQGLFGVFIPLIYGEKEHAFIRLKKAIGEQRTEDDNLDHDSHSRKRRKLDNVLQSEGDQDDLLQTFAFPEMRNRRLDIEQRHQSTCEWILNTREYKKWLADPNGLFWVKGKPGAGKSTVMAFIFDELKTVAKHNLRDSSEIRLEFFFSARGTELQQTFLGMLRSLMHQLFLQDKSSAQRIRDIFCEKRRTSGTSSNRWKWHLSELKTMFAEIVIPAGQQRSLTLFVDALDEAGERSARQMAQYFHQLNENSILHQTSIKICISCRHYPIVVSKQTSLEVVVELHNKDDIATFIRDTLCLDHAVNETFTDSDDWQALGVELNERANGIFQWAHLVVPMVQKRIDKGESLELIHKNLRNVPADLRDVYIHIFRHVIDEEDRPLSFQLFQWVCLAARPLTVTELRFALSMSESPCRQQHMTRTANNHIASTDDRMRLRIRPLSGGLIETIRDEQRGAEVVQFSHQSVNDFMQSEGLLLLSSLSVGKIVACGPVGTTNESQDFIPHCHRLLYRACLDYLTTGDVLETKIRNVNQDEFPRFGRFRKLPFVDYATRYVFTHAQKAGNERSDSLMKEVETLQRMIRQWVKLYRMLDHYHPDSPARGTKLFHVACQTNMADIVKHLIAHGQDIQVQNSEGQTALHVAAKYGNLNIVALLLSLGADINAVDEHEQTALFSATARGHSTTVRWLLHHGATMSDSERGHSVLYCAALFRHIELVNLFVSLGAELDRIGGPHGTALHAASYEGDETIVQILLSAGANINEEAGFNGTALQIASFRGHQRVVKVLLDRGASVNVLAGNRRTALNAACDKGHLRIVELLLERGAEVNPGGAYYSAALYMASEEGHERIVELLLVKGAEVDVIAGTYGTELQAASRKGYLGIVEKLLAGGADVNLQAGCYHTALQAACYGGHESTVRALLAAGADADIQGGLFGSAIGAAKRCGYKAIQDLLLAKSRSSNE